MKQKDGEREKRNRCYKDGRRRRRIKSKKTERERKIYIINTEGGGNMKEKD